MAPLPLLLRRRPLRLERGALGTGATAGLCSPGAVVCTGPGWTLGDLPVLYLSTALRRSRLAGGPPGSEPLPKPRSCPLPYFKCCSCAALWASAVAVACVPAADGAAVAAIVCAAVLPS